MKVVQVITVEDDVEWELLTAYIAAQPASVKVAAGERTITTIIEGPVIEAPTGPVFEWEHVQPP